MNKFLLCALFITSCAHKQPASSAASQPHFLQSRDGKVQNCTLDGSACTATIGEITGFGTGVITNTIIELPKVILRVTTNPLSPHECEDGLVNVVAVYPGAVCLRKDLSWKEALKITSTNCSESYGNCASMTGQPFIDTILSTMPVPQYPHIRLDVYDSTF